MKKTYAVLLSFLVLSLSLPAQKASRAAAPTTQVALGHSVVALTGPWKFHIGDNPSWADPNFDDSGWETVSLAAKQESIDPMMGTGGFSPGWTAKGHSGYAGYAWYRIRIRITGADGPLALLAPTDVDDSYQLYTDGRLVGSFGSFVGPIPSIYYSRPLMFSLPASVVQQNPDGTTVIAFRFYMAPRTLLQPQSGGMHGPPILRFGQRDHRGLSRRLGRPLSVLLLCPAGGHCVRDFYPADSHAVRVRPRREAAAMATGSLCCRHTVLFDCFRRHHHRVDGCPAAGRPGLDCVFGIYRLVANDMVGVFGLQDKKWIRNTIGSLILWDIATSLLFQSLLLGGFGSHRVFAAQTVNNFATSTAAIVLLVVIAYFGIRRAQRIDWMLCLAVLFYAIPALDPELRLLHIQTAWFPFGILVTLPDIASFAVLLCLSIVLLRRFRSSQRRQQALEQDVRQAQEVQQVLIPEELPHVPGLTIESEYRPAREVGGDFFQILPHPIDGSMLLVVGDVTGKGLQAGMLVALIVGAIRAEAAHGSDPLTALNALNQRLCGRGQAHATCLALRIASDGAVTLANAGHLPPYLNGKELSMEGALPLGMTPTAKFSVMHFQLASRDTLLLMSDGVVEAQDEHGQLFGFDRVNGMLQKPITAGEVAAAAQAFGQQDDILVLRIVRNASEVSRTPAEPALVAG